MVVIYCGSFIRVNFITTVLFRLMLVAAYEVSAVLLNPLPLIDLLSNNFFLLMATGVGLLSSYIQETQTRKGLYRPPHHRGKERDHQRAAGGSQQGQSFQERIPGQYEPRAAHAAERDHRLLRHHGQGDLRRRSAIPATPLMSRTSPPAAIICFRSSTTFSIWPRRKPTSSPWTNARSTSSRW